MTPPNTELAEAGFHEWKTERNRILRELDITASGIPADMALISLHKARYECTCIEPELRHESRKWLQANGYKRLMGEFLPEGELPE